MVREQYEVRWKDYYEIMQVHSKAEAEVIAVAYRRLAMMYHPDKNRDPLAQERFKLINEANEVLSDPERRARYDLVYQQAQSGASADGPFSQYEEDTGQTYDRWQHDQGQDSDGYADSGWEYDQQYTWHEEPEPSRGKEPESDYYTYEPRPENVFSLAFGKWLLPRFADWVSPNPDESQRILPWPSWKWQRLWLLSSIPLFALLAFIFVVQAAWAVFCFIIILLASAVYSGSATSWLRATRASPIQARIAGAAAITLSGISYSLMIAYVLFALVLLVISVVISFGMLRAAFDHSLGGGRR